MAGVGRARATRGRLLDAAAAVLQRRGAHALTLEAVAREAGVSKGGLLYHFPSKAAILDALTDRWNDHFEAQIAELDDETPGGWARAYVRASDLTQAGEDARAWETGLLAALAAEPERLEPVRRRYAAWQERISDDGVDPTDATVARLAADGLWIAELLGFAPPEGELRARVLERMLALTDGQPAAP